MPVRLAQARWFLSLSENGSIDGGWELDAQLSHFKEVAKAQEQGIFG